jgi:predicted site-specific integrase-resolvase
MIFDELPLLLKLGDVERLTGINKRSISEMVDSGQLAVVRMNQTGRRYYTRESVKKFLNVKGEEKIPD